MNQPTLMQVIGATLFALAVLHTFSTKFFERLSHTNPRHAGIWHLLGEVEVVFGFWALVLMLFMFGISGKEQATAYFDSRNFTEPLFVFAIMVIAATRPILQFAGTLMRFIARYVPLPQGMALYFLVLSFVPVLGSVITEPAAMTLGIIALSLAVSPALSSKGGYALVPDALHAPLEQGYIITKRAASNPLAKQFADYLGSPSARSIMVRYGFVLPSEVVSR